MFDFTTTEYATGEYLTVSTAIGNDVLSGVPLYDNSLASPGIVNIEILIADAPTLGTDVQVGYTIALSTDPTNTFTITTPVTTYSIVWAVAVSSTWFNALPFSGPIAYFNFVDPTAPSTTNAKFKIVNITNDRLQLSEISGDTSVITHGRDITLFYYDNNDPVNLDSSIQSAYLDTELGLRAEDINIDGGRYYDTFSSHAPEELVPGQTFEHLDIKVYTKIFSNTQIVAYRMVSNAISDSSGTDVGYWPKYYKIANTSVLTSNLNLTDASISVADASVFPAPDITFNTPGVIYINGEKIVYWRNYATESKTAWIANTVVSTGSLITYSGNIYLTLGNVYAATFANISANVTQVSANTLAQIRRGADKTGTPLVHLSGSTIEDSGVTSLIPSSGESNGNVHLNTWLNLNPDTAQRFFVTDLGDFMTNEADSYITTTFSSAFLDGSGLENSDTVQAVFLRGS